ncbi:MAG: DMT family transporter [Frankiaceae bacterium]
MAAGRPAVHRPGAADSLLIAVAVGAVSTSGPLIASASAVVPALAIAFWRNAMASAVLVPASLLRRLGELRGMRKGEWLLAVAAGLLLAGHFGTWVPSLTLTPVASATALVATQPIWQAVIARAGGALVPARAWAGICLAVGGAAWLSGADFSLSGRQLLGDLLAVVAGAFGAGYVAVGAQVRRSVSTTTYTAVCYGTTAAVLAAVCLAGRIDLAGYPATGWAKLVALTVGAQLLGHSLFNVVLRTTSPTVVALALLLEVPGAALIAAVWLGQVPPAADWPAAALLLAGIAVVVTSVGRQEPALPPQ